MPDGDHQMVNIALAGVKSARTATKPGEVSEPWSEEARFFTESRLLQRPVKVQILSLPNATPTPFQQSASLASNASASIFIGNGRLHHNSREQALSIIRSPASRW